MFDHKVYSHRSPPPQTFEVNCGEKIVDASGYVPTKVRVQNMIRAGKELLDFRKLHYDYGENDPDDGLWMDPLRAPGLDLSDVSALQGRALSNLREQAKRQLNEESKVTEKKDSLSAAREAQDAPKGTKPDKEPDKS